jgi:predicted dehydrogenase
MTGQVRIGVAGTSWWADAMYLPALAHHPLADVRAITGARPEHTREVAATWGIPAAFDSFEAMLESSELDAVLILTPNVHHHAMTMAALERGLHVLCEKPLALDSTQAREMTEAAERLGVVTMCPFTYSFMPFARYTKHLVDEGWLGRPYHLDLRYFSGYGRDGGYMWRLDPGIAGAGVVADLGSHWIYVARWLFGDIEAVSALFGRSVARGARPDGRAYTPAEDSAIVSLEFTNGATGSIHVSAVAHEPTPFGQLHAWDLHGSDGTLHVACDWDRVERVEGARAGDAALHELPIPDRFYEGVRRGSVPDTYRDTFRARDHMARGFVTAIATGQAAVPSFRDGWLVQRVIDAAVRSAAESRRVAIAEIADGERAAATG